MRQQLKRIYDDLASGALSQEDALAKIKAAKLQEPGRGSLLVTPVWETSAAGAGHAGYAEHHVILCDLAVDPELLEWSTSLRGGQERSIAERYSDHAVACFERIQTILRGKPRGQVLVQIVAASDGEHVLLAGLSALLKTAALENPRFTGQLLLVPADITAGTLARHLKDEQSGGRDPLIQYRGGVRQVSRWQDLPAETEPSPVAFKDDGVYLITGGMGGLGMLFAEEILAGTSQARVVMAGRSPGPSESRTRVSYAQADVSDPAQVTRLFAAIREEHGQLNGILHCAGVVADNFILKKSVDEFRAVLAPKVSGTFHLDQASRDVELDFFVLFSSTAAALGNPGQADYACANAFLDAFAGYRNGLVAAKQRHGRTRSIGWPLWQAGGMGIDPSSRELLHQATGMLPMQTATGLRAFHRSLALPYDRTMVLEGELEQMRTALLTGSPIQVQPQPRPSASSDANSLVEDTEGYLRQQLSALLKMPSSRIDPQAPLEKYGIDSILAMKLTSQLEKTFGTLSKTLFFEYQSIRELSGYFVQSHAATLAGLFTDRSPEPIAAAAPVQRQRTSRRASTHTRSVAASPAPAASDRIAIIGLSGRYPEAFDVDAYWRNLRDGKDCIVEVPKERWDWQAHFSDDRTKEGQHYSKWGGFIAGVDEFDPLFFNISPKDAKLIDPQERLFLQHAWMAMEDAGYTRAGLQVPSEHDLAGQVGVYVGVMYNEYQLFGAESSAQGKPLGIAGSVASIANRVSYVLNLHGPSMTLDTMCSSSLTAIHIACQDLKQGRTTLAIAGGVNVSIHPNKYLVLSAGQFISSDGHCQSFGEGGDGYIPGEGVGVVILKRLSEAERDGDHIYGVIRGSALTHGGKTNGYTVPNPQAQSSAIGRALAETATDARHISYVEAHGTGTKLGDPIEIAALNKAFHHYTRDAAFCRIGSAKSNIGHCESAAGIAGLTKVLLQMQHRQIVPSLHSAALNPHIDFDSSPFVVNQSLTTWQRPVVDGRELPRLAGISSFGAGGSNAHMIVEEYQPVEVEPIVPGKVVILLSARTAEQLQQKARELLAFVRERAGAIDLTAMSYTLQLGREPMEERLGMVVTTVDQLLTKLQAYVAGEQAIEDAYQGQVKRNREALSVFTSDADLQQTIDKWIAVRKFPKLLDLWVKGLDVDWSGLYGDSKPPRISLPTYPFARERYWIDVAPVARVAVKSTAAVIHPLLHQNTSDLNQQSYSSTFSGEELFLNDAAAYLEMARAAIATASASSREMQIELRDVVWAQSPVFDRSRQISIALLPRDAHQIDYEIYSRSGDEEVIHCQGRAVLSAPTEEAALDIEKLERNGELLVRLRAPESAEETWGDYVLHPSILGDALKAAGGTAQLLARIETLRIVEPCSREMVAWVRPASDKVDIDLCDARGNIAVQIRGIAWRPAPVSIVVPAAPPVMTEIVLPQAIPARRGVALTAPNARTTAASSSSGRPAITLSKTRRGPADQNSLPRAASSVRLYDAGNGIFSIQVAERDSIADLLQAMELVQQNASVKVLILAGLDRCFARGGREDYNEAVDRHLFRGLIAFSYPVIAVLQGDASGAAVMAAALCDFMVCNEDATYGYTDASRHFYPTIPELSVFTERFGDVLVQDFLYGSSVSTGRQLRAKGWTCPIVSAAQVETHAQQLAATLATKSRDALRLLKQHLTRHLVPLAAELTRVDVAPEQPSGGVAHSIASPSAHIRIDTPADQVLVVTLARTGEQDLIAHLGRIFTEAQQGAYYKAIVLAGDFPEGDVRDLRRLIVESPIPFVAALAGDAKGTAWLAAQFCDATVYSRTGVYSTAGISESVAPDAATVFTHRLGPQTANEILLTSADYSGIELQERVPALTVTERELVLPTAVQLAVAWSALPRPALAAWKTHTATRIRQLPATPAWEQNDDASEPRDAPTLSPSVSLSLCGEYQPLQSKVVTVTAHPDGVVVVQMADREAKNMFSDALLQGLSEAFAHIGRTPAYKAVVLTGYDSYFASGGTKETLLDVQQGKTIFTDFKMFQLPLDCRLPVIAAMQGHGIGAGWALGMFADVVLLSDESRYVSPYMDYGFTPGAGATWVLAEKMGHDLARESLLTARHYAGRELKERGLALRVLPRADVVAAAMELAGRMARAPRARLIGLKQQLTAPFHQPLEETYRLELAMHDRTFVGHAEVLEQIEKNFLQTIVEPAVAPQRPVELARPSVDNDVLPALTAVLRTLLANELQMRESDVDEHAKFVDLGLESIGGVTWVRKINEKYRTSIDPTQVYSHPTLAEFSRYVREEAEKQGPLASPVMVVAPTIAKSVLPDAPAEVKLTSWRTATATRFTAVAPASNRPQPIAIIGMAGQFPQAKNLEEFWQNIAQGKNCITEVSPDRWDVNGYYQPGDAVPGKTNGKWVGALDDYDRFDPLFFNISPKEAESMDPQQRLFLQACWHGIENAGYDARSLAGSKCGVFVGCAYGDYHLLSREQQLSAQGFTGDATSILAGRVSYFLDLQGPCLSIDTACSSSLVAVANACDSLISGSSDLALAGGVYVMAGPEMHVKSAQVGMFSAEGKCFTFDQRANGFVPGEGVGVVLLKRLADAQRDGDIIQAVIQGWGVNQDGKTNGITAPNAESQTRLEQEVYDRYDIDPAKIQLIEAHGTGTKLGDPIEVQGLKAAFRKYTANKEYCALGAVKTNIGHCLTAAGIAGVTKLVLALKHKQLPPTINFERLNEHIDLQDSPFYVNSRLQEWESAQPRLAAISAFGFSGTNAHVVIGEYLPPAVVKQPVTAMTQNGNVIIPLSARTAEQLQQKAVDLLKFVDAQAASIDLFELAYTLQIGRDPMEERLAIMAGSVEQLVAKLKAFVNGEPEIAGVHQAQVKRSRESMSVITQDDDVKETIVAKWVAGRKLSKLAELWAKGLELDWSLLYGDVRPRRISLPLYPFGKERYWIASQPAATPGAQRREIVLAPIAAPVVAPKRAAISLGTLGTAVVPASAPAGRPAITLASTTPQAATYGGEDGVFSIDIVASTAKQSIAQLLQALERIEREESARVLILNGIERCFAHGGRGEYNEAVAQKLYPTLVSFPYPVIAVLHGDTTGGGFLAAALCDFMVCNEDARYGYTDTERHFYPTSAEADLFGQRFGEVAAQDLLYASTTLKGSELRVKGWTMPILPAAQLETYAKQLASTLATKSQDALRLLKLHLSRQLAGLANALTHVETVPPEATAAGAVDLAPTEHIRLETPAENVLVLRFSDSPGLLLELTDVLGQVQHAPDSKAVVLVSDDGEFLPSVPDEDALNYQRLFAGSQIPIVVALTGSAKGAAWVIAQSCDAAVYSREGVYSIGGPSAAITRTAAATAMHRFGSGAGKEILLTGAEYSGADLQRRIGTVAVAERDDVLSAAIKLATAWAQLPRTSLNAWKHRSAAALQEQVRGLPAVFEWEASGDTPEPLVTVPTPIALRSTVVTATAHPDGIVVVKMEDRDAKNMFSDAFVNGVAEAFAHIEKTPAYKVVVLTGYDSYFASGGTKEGLLAIQRGSAKFTDFDIHQLAFDCKLPVIAAMQGHGIGAGWCLGMFADLVLLSEESRYVSPYMDYGFTPGAGATYILAGKIGNDLARESLLTAQHYSGSDLETRGLRLAILPRAEVLPAAMELAKQVARSSRPRLLGLKQLLIADMHQPLEETYRLEVAMHEKTFVGHANTLTQIQNRFQQELEAPAATPQQVPVERAGALRDDDVLPVVTATLRTLLATELRLRESDIDDDVEFVDVGLDSISAVTWMRTINEKYQTSIEATKVYRFPTLNQLARYVKEEADKQGTLAPPVAEAPPVDVPLQKITNSAAPRELQSPRTPPPSPVAVPVTKRSQSIAVIGMSGRLPQAANLEEFWQNIAQGRNSVTEVPPDRWDVKRYYDPDPASKDKIHAKWLGALDDVGGFDPRFFRISPQEAEYMDPQHRLFLQESYRAFEDAGYAGHALSDTKCGVYLGISNNDYSLRLAQSGVRATPVTSNSFAIAAARIAYHLNLKGPAISVDTACSSSLVAIHLACQALLSGETDMALAGGVTLWLTPESHLSMSEAGMLSPVGQCRAFDDEADGIVLGDGVGALVLKRLDDAQADNDSIYGVILGSGINQDGRTNGITAPSVNSQIELERSVYAKLQIDPATITYVEAHGTGTKLGDPIELEALAAAFSEKTANKNYCAIGSVKSNIGHTASAAGVASVLKVLLSMRHRTLVPTLNVAKENSHFDFSNSPFYVSRETQAWDPGPGGVRRAAVSSFGYSGTNAHLVMEEYAPPRPPLTRESGPFLVPLSARTADQLQQKAQDLLQFLRSSHEDQAPIDLADLAYTLQVGRDAMEERLGFVVGSVEQLGARLSAYVGGEKNIVDTFRGGVESGSDGMSVIARDEDMQEAVDKWIARKKFSKLLELWVSGMSFDWNKLHGGAKPRRVSLPTYPFSTERYWIDEVLATETQIARFEETLDLRSIEEIMSRIEDEALETEQAVEMLRMLVPK